MTLTAYETVAIFMRDAHTEEDPVCQAAERVAKL